MKLSSLKDLRVIKKDLAPDFSVLRNVFLPPAIIAAIVSIWAGLDALSWHKVLASALVVGGVILVSRSRAAVS